VGGVRVADLERELDATDESPRKSGRLEPIVVAEVIHQAATDGTNRLRYTAGDDAAQFMAHRKAADDEEFIGGLKKQFGL